MGAPAPRPRHVAIGLAGLISAPARAVAGAGIRATSPVWRPIVEPLARRGETTENAVLDAISGPITDELTHAILERRVVERVIQEVLADETLERLLAIADDERVASRVGDSELVAAIAAQLAVSEELLSVVGSIVRTPEVREAITAQSTGLATEVADQLRDRTTSVDDHVESIARRLLRRPRSGTPTIELPEQ